MKKKKLLMEKIDAALVENDWRVRSRRELVQVVVRAVGQWERQVGPAKCRRAHIFQPALDGGIDPDKPPPRIRITTRAGEVITR